MTAGNRTQPPLTLVTHGPKPLDDAIGPHPCSPTSWQLCTSLPGGQGQLHPQGQRYQKPQDTRTKVAPSLVLPCPRGALGLQLRGWEPPHALLGALDPAVLAGLWVLIHSKGDGLWYRVMALT